MKVPLEKNGRAVVGPVPRSWGVHERLLLDVVDGSGKVCKKKLCRQDVICLNSTEICRRDVRDWSVADTQSYERTGRLLAAVVELMRAGELKFKTRLEGVRALREAESVRQLLERTDRLARGCYTKWSVRHGRALGSARGNEAARTALSHIHKMSTDSRKAGDHLFCRVDKIRFFGAIPTATLIEWRGSLPGIAF